jgi:hypothetical protein
MPLYHIHIYREMRLLFQGIKAATPEEAARIAADKPALEARVIDDCEGENIAALVDVAGDADYAHSRHIEFEPERLRKAAQALLEALAWVRATLHLRHLDEASDADVKEALEIADAALAQAQLEKLRPKITTHQERNAI